MERKREYLRFQSGKPEKIALQFSQGVPRDGMYGPQVYYTLVDGRGLYLEEAAASLIKAAGIQPKQEFWMVKRPGPNKRTAWELFFEDPSKPQLEVMPKPIQSEKAAPPPWTEALLDQTTLLTDVYAAAVKHASEQHGGLVKNEDVRTILVSCFINLSQRGKTA